MKKVLHSRAVLAAVAICCLAAQPAQAQVAVFSLQSVDALMSDVKYILKMGGREDFGNQIEGLIAALSPDGKPFGGIDTKRPLGVYSNLPKEGAEPEAVAFIPISKESQFLELLTKVNVPYKKGEKDVYEVTPPQGGQTIYLRFANEHAYISNKAEQLQGKLTAPGTAIPASHKGSLLAMTVRLDQIPKELKQQALAQVESQLDAEKEKRPGENQFEFQARQAVTKLAREIAGSLINDATEVTLSLQVDQKVNGLALDVSMSARAGSPLAGHIKAFGTNRSMFSGLAKNSALNMLACVPVPAEFQTSMLRTIDQALEEALKNAKSDAEREIARKLLDAIKPTLKSEALDFGAVMYGPMDGDKYTLVGGVQVKEGRNLEKAVLDAAKHIPDRDKKNVKFNVDKIGDVNVHLIRVDETPDDNFKKHLGEPEFYVAALDNAVLFAMGQNAKQALKDAVNGLKNGKDSSTAPIQFEASVSKLAPLANNDDGEKVREAAKKLFTGPLANRDRVRLSVQGGDTLRVRLDAHAELLKLVFELAPLPGG
jgi:hypothetical protein